MVSDKNIYGNRRITEGKTYRYFNTMYGIALAVIAIVSISTQMIIQSYLADQKEELNYLHLFEEQARLTQRLTQDALQFNFEKELVNIHTFENSILSWQKNHLDILKGNELLSIALPNEWVKSTLSELELPFDKILKGSEGIVFVNEQGEGSNVSLEPYLLMMIHNEKAYLEGMVFISNKLGQQAKEKVDFLRRLEFIFLGVFILALILEIILIFNPVAKKIQKVISSLVNSEARAMQMANELNVLNNSLQKTDKDFRDINFALEKATIMMKTDNKGLITDANDRYCDITKYSRNELIGRPLFFNNQGGDESIIYDHIRNEQKKTKLWQGEIFDQGKLGGNFWLDVTMIPIVSMEGDIYQYLVICSDITKRKEAEKLLKEITERRHKEQMNEQKNRSNTVLLGQEQERKRMAREIHDGVGQMLTALKFNCEALNPLSEQQVTELGTIKGFLQNIIKEIRRISSDLLPTVLSDFGLVAAIREMVSNLDATSVTIVLEDDVVDGHIFTQTQEISLYRIAQEAVNNSLKYSQAEQIRIVLNTDAEFINLSIIDNGVGFDPAQMIKSNRYKTTGNGLTSMRERAELVGGKLSIDSKHGKGTTVDVEVPLEKDNYE